MFLESDRGLEAVSDLPICAIIFGWFDIRSIYHVIYNVNLLSVIHGHVTDVVKQQSLDHRTNLNHRQVSLATWVR